MKVLLAIEGSAPSQVAVAEVAERPWPNGTVIEVLTVVHPAVPLALDPAFALAAAHVDQLHEQRRNAKAVVDEAMNQIRALAPGLELKTKMLEGNPKDVIVQEARDWGQT